MDVRKLADEIARAIAEQGVAVNLGSADAASWVWVPDIDCMPVRVVSDDPWPPCVVVTMWEVNQRGERRYVGTRIYPNPEGG